ncbi:MAG: MFS transporter [Candidatus Wallbacteria bacterium]|nr:MFS transporter [Candidatus Wallbacteria bacterium]
MNRLFNKNFYLLWQGQLISQIGNQAFEIALLFWIKHATGSATLMGLIMMASTLPSVLLGPVGGTFADLHSRKRILVISDLICGTILFLMTAALFLWQSNTNLIICCLFTTSVFISTVNSFFKPAISASIPDLVPLDKIAAANSLNESSVQISTFIGQGLGGVLFRLLGPVTLFLADGISFFLAAFSESLITIPQVIPEKKTGFSEIFRHFKLETIEGFRYVWQRKGIRNLFVIAAFLNFFMIPVITLLPFYIEDVLKATTDWYGYLLAGFGFGALIGYTFAGTVRVSGKVRSIIVPILIVVNSAAMGLLALLSSPIQAMLLMFLAGIMNGFINISIITILQLTTASEIRGRVFGLLGTICSGITPIAMGLAGVVADLLNKNIPAIYIFCGSAGAILSLLVGLDRATREFLAYEPEKPRQH